MPFLAEAMWQNLAVADVRRRGAPRACTCRDYPPADAAAIDEPLSERMNLVREIVSLGRAARMGAKLKVRQPLAKVEVILADRTHQAWLEEHAALIAEELNVKQVEFTEQADQYITYTVLPDLKRLGPRLGKQLPELKKALAAADAGALLGPTGEPSKSVTLDSAGRAEWRSMRRICKSACKPSRAGPRRRARPASWCCRPSWTNRWWPKAWPASWCTRFKRSARTWAASTPIGSRSALETDDAALARRGRAICRLHLQRNAGRADRAGIAGRALKPIELKIGAIRAKLYVQVVTA